MTGNKAVFCPLNEVYHVTESVGAMLLYLVLYVYFMSQWLVVRAFGFKSHSRQQAACSRQWATGSRQRAVGNR